MSALLALFCLTLLFPLCLRRAGLCCQPSEDVTVRHMADTENSSLFHIFSVTLCPCTSLRLVEPDRSKSPWQ